MAECKGRGTASERDGVHKSYQDIVVLVDTSTTTLDGELTFAVQ